MIVDYSYLDQYNSIGLDGIVEYHGGEAAEEIISVVLSTRDSRATLEIRDSLAILGTRDSLAILGTRDSLATLTTRESTMTKEEL